MSRLISQAQYSRRSGYSTGYISQLVKKGIITLRDGKIDPAQADAAIKANIDHSRQLKSEAAKKRWRRSGSETSQLSQMDLRFEGGDGKGYEGPSLTEARRDRELQKLKIEELEYMEKKGDLVPRAQATEWLSQIISNARSHLWGLPKRMAVVVLAKLIEALRSALVQLPAESQAAIDPLIVALRFDTKDVEQELRSSIREVLEEMGTHLQRAKKDAHASKEIQPRKETEANKETEKHAASAADPE